MKALGLILLMLSGYGVFWYQNTAMLCPTPIYYRVGEINESFAVSLEKVKGEAEQAEKIWEELASRELFVYDENADFTIDLVFDERQALVDEEASQRFDLDVKQEENNKLLNTIELLKKEYRELSADYEQKVKEYEERLARYNQEVTRYNDRGGAPNDVFAQLETERGELEGESDSLNKIVTQLNSVANKINRLSEQGNKMVDLYNQEVGEYNRTFGEEHEFTQGDYQGDGIHVYKFVSNEELRAVLAHEFGHALGIGHVAGTSSLMYYLLEDIDDQLILTMDDREAFVAVCGSEDTLGQKVRRFIREL